ncbi:cell wall metabolism sensor histidine kinase WalK, partial [Listeria welshimeri]|nr:cell wall metabolism sensor histidine kinase WalK [Listeria welshimeri]
IEQKTLPLQIEEVNVNDMMEQSVKTVSELATLKEISIQKKWDKNKTILIENEGDRLQQILINLLSNAIQYTPAKGEISLQLEDLGDEIQLIVKDNGIGIPAKDLERIFERFYRVDKARTRHSGGTGLGLSIVKHLVDMMEGTIHVTSQENVGTTFYIRLPKHR